MRGYTLKDTWAKSSSGNVATAQDLKKWTWRETMKIATNTGWHHLTSLNYGLCFWNYYIKDTLFRTGEPRPTMLVGLFGSIIVNQLIRKGCIKHYRKTWFDNSNGSTSRFGFVSLNHDWPWSRNISDHPAGNIDIMTNRLFHHGRWWLNNPPWIKEWCWCCGWWRGFLGPVN